MPLNVSFLNYLKTQGWFYLCSVALAVSLWQVLFFTLAQVAQTSAFNRHPDEVYHLDAYCYFESHLWPPALNSEAVLYTPDGISRVYTGEGVYWLYGRLVGSLRAVFPPPAHLSPSQPFNLPYHFFIPMVYTPLYALCRTQFNLAGVQPYRWVNLALFGVTVSVALYAAARQPQLGGVVGVWLAFPQVGYVYAYASSDAWGCTWGMILLVYATLGNRLRSAREAVGLGILLGLVLTANLPFWLGLPLPILAVICQMWCAPQPLPWRTLMRNLGLALGVALWLCAPLKIIYPLLQGFTTYNHQYQIISVPHLVPAYVGQPTFGMAQHGVPFQAVWSNLYWYELSAKSFYGVFGYMNIFAPDWVYGAAALGLSLQLLATGIVLLRRWADLPKLWRVLLLSAPGVCGLVVAASLYHTWNYDWQVQGRYLFGALPALALLLGGTWPYEPHWLRVGRLMVWGLLGLLNVWVLQTVVVSGAYFR